MKRLAYKSAMHPVSSALVYLAIITNCLIQGLQQYPRDDYAPSLVFSTLSCLFCVLDQVVRLYGLGGETYLSNQRFNQFDLLLTSIASLHLVSNNPTIEALSCLMALRLFRLFVRRSQKGNSISILIASFFDLVPIFMAFSMFFALHIYVFSILGMNLFQGRVSGLFRTNFDSFWVSFSTVFQIILRQHWNEVWYMAYLAVGSQAHLYFLVLLTSGQYIILQSFMAIMLGIYQSNRRIQTFQVQKANHIIRKIFKNNKHGLYDQQEVIRQPYLSSSILDELKNKLDKKGESNIGEEEFKMISDDEFKVQMAQKVLETDSSAV